MLNNTEKVLINAWFDLTEQVVKNEIAHWIVDATLERSGSWYSVSYPTVEQ